MSSKTAEMRGLAVGQHVLVRMRGGGGGHEVEQGGTVTELAGKGVFVKLDKGGNSNFFYANKVRADLKPVQIPTPRPGTIGTLGEVVRIKPPPHHDAKPSEPVRIGMPAPTSIGEFIYAERQARGIYQEAFARAIGVSTVTLSEYERGIRKPTDDDLLQLAEVFDLDAGIMEQLTSQWQTKGPAAGPAVSPGRETSVSPVSDTVPGTVPGTSGAAGFEDFMERLIDLAPLPIDREKRRLWMGLARSLFELERGT